MGYGTESSFLMDFNLLSHFKVLDRNLNVHFVQCYISVFPLLYLKGASRPVYEWLIAKMLTAATVICSTVVVPKCCGYLWLPTLSSEAHN